MYNITFQHRVALVNHLIRRDSLGGVTSCHVCVVALCYIVTYPIVVSCTTSAKTTQNYVILNINDLRVQHKCSTSKQGLVTHNLHQWYSTGGTRRHLRGYVK
jgi:hypothetical protein